MGKVGEVEDTVDQRQTDGAKGQDAAGDETVDYELEHTGTLTPCPSRLEREIGPAKLAAPAVSSTTPPNWRGQMPYAVPPPLWRGHQPRPAPGPRTQPPPQNNARIFRGARRAR